MYLEYDEEKIKKIETITAIDYESKGNFIPYENATVIFDDLLLEIERLEEIISDLREDISENYELKERSMYEEYGISEKDFI